jgi:hypothetical protein
MVALRARGEAPRPCSKAQDLAEAERLRKSGGWLRMLLAQRIAHMPPKGRLRFPIRSANFSSARRTT